MLTFYLIAGGLAVLAAAVLARPLIAGRGAAEGRDARDAQVFRDQLGELERDLARGTISPSEAEGARVEISRRLIAADERARRAAAPAPAPQGHSGLVAGLALIGTPALAAALYFGIGAPGMPDQPLSAREGLAGLPAGHPSAQGMERPSQEEAEAQMAGQIPPPEGIDPQYADLVKRLEQTVAGRPNDVEGHRLLANALMQLGRYGEAWRTYDKVIELTGGSAGPEIRAAKAEGMILAAGGYVSPEAADVIATALQRDPTLPMARYYAGLALRQAGRLDDAIALWEGLRRDSAPDAPYLEWLDMMLADAMAARQGPGQSAGLSAGQSAGQAQQGPGQAEIEAAGELSPEERSAMIEGMVARLDERLTRQGGSADEWMRLIASYATLGRRDEALRAYERALGALGEDAGADAVRAQAARLGLSGAAATTSPAPPPGAATGPAMPGPTQGDIAAAGQMSAGERSAMIEGMVAQLEGRLTTEGGSAEEWLRLIRSYVQLGRPEEAERAYQLAAAALAGDPSAGLVREQALLMGVAVQ